METRSSTLVAVVVACSLWLGCATGVVDNSCTEASAILSECGVSLAESQFGTCDAGQEALAAQVIDAYAQKGCAWYSTGKNDGFVCTVLPIMCIEHTPAELAPVTTDGCSMFVDGPPSDPTRWQHCCLEHDMAYYQGGTAEDRIASDEALRACFAAESNTALAAVVYAAVRFGGTPALPTPWRWGYGWKYDPFHGYRTLPSDQAAAAAAKVAAFRANPVLPPTIWQRLRALGDAIASVPGLRAMVDKVNTLANSLD